MTCYHSRVISLKGPFENYLRRSCVMNSKIKENQRKPDFEDLWLFCGLEACFLTGYTVSGTRQNCSSQNNGSLSGSKLDHSCLFRSVAHRKVKSLLWPIGGQESGGRDRFLLKYWKQDMLIGFCNGQKWLWKGHQVDPHLRLYHYFRAKCWWRERTGF